MEIIIKGSRYVRGNSTDWNSRRKDELHKRRKELAESIKDGIMSKTQMNKGEEGEPEFDKQVQKYSQWVTVKDKEIREFHNINREFKKHGTEGLPHSLDDLRKEGRLRYD